MPIGFIRRLARQSLGLPSYASGVNVQLPSLQDNWTTQETDTYDDSDPAMGPAAWGGTVANLDRVLTATGGGYTVFGALLTFVNKPEGNSLGQSGSFGGIIAKVQPTYAAGSTAAFEVWSRKSGVWTKRRRLPLASVCRSGETVVLDATGPVLLTADVDAYWITLAPDLGTETLSWLALHVYGICLNDPVTPDCAPGTPPEDCDGPECGVDIESWVCLDPPEEPDPAPDPDPFVLPPILVQVPNPTTWTHPDPAHPEDYYHACPPPNRILMSFGDIPGGGSVVVDVANAHGVTFAEGTQQTISAPGTMTWTVLAGFRYKKIGGYRNPALPPDAEDATTDFFFTRKLDGTAFEVAGNLLNILLYFWSASLGYEDVC